MKKWYNNVGNKICMFAKVQGWIGIVCTVVCLLGIVMDTVDVAGLYGTLIGLGCFVSSWFTYGFGQIVIDIHNMSTKAPAAAPQAQYSDLPEL